MPRSRDHLLDVKRLLARGHTIRNITLSAMPAYPKREAFNALIGMAALIDSRS